MWILFLLSVLKADQVTHKYSDGEDVILWFNKLVPFNNPQESYAYSSLPLCAGKGRERKYSMGLGEAIEGYELEDSGLDIKFTSPSVGQTLCEINPDSEQKDLLIESIKRKYWLQMYIDDLPIWSSIGDYDADDDKAFIFTHYSFLISFNGNRIILARANFEKPVNIKAADKLTFTYSIAWISTETPFSQRFNSYLDPGFFENNIHWFSIINSFVMVMLLCALVILIIYRTVTKDYDKYNAQEIESNEFVETKGWKQVAGDAFKTPDYLPVFTFAVSTGWHLAILTAFAIFTSILHPMYSERGSLSYYILMEYALLGCIAGFTCGSLYTEYRGKKLVGTALFSATAFPCIIAIISTSLNITAYFYSSSAAMPILTVLEITALMCFVYLPLFAFGLLLGKRYRMKRPITYRINSVQSPILRGKNVFNHPLVLIFCGGILPFSSIYVEIYYVFTSFWNYKFYYVYGFTLASFALFAVSVACVAIVATYSTLNSEDYRWHWVSFLSAGSVGFYLYLYAIYYYFFKTSMSGYFQFTFYFSYMIMGSLYLGLVAGAIGYTASYSFVKRIYSNIKSE